MTKDITQSINHDYTMESQVDMHEYGGSRTNSHKKAVKLQIFALLLPDLRSLNDPSDVIDSIRRECGGSLLRRLHRQTCKRRSIEQ